MRMNTTPRNTLVTHEGAMAHPINAEQQLRRSVMACLLWEDQFYESGESIADRIKSLVPHVEASKVAAMAVEAREKMKLRHVPLLLTREMVRYPSHNKFAGDTLARVIQRADELAEFCAILWSDNNGKHTLPHSVRKGLAYALTKFDEYQLAKYKGDDKKVKLRDVLRMVRPRPATPAQADLWRKAVKGELATPDTWEVSLSANDGVDKKDKWERLVLENKLGGLALLRNLRNMEKAGVSREYVRLAINKMNASRVLPFRFIAAARATPHWEPALEEKLFECVVGMPKLPGNTIILVDVSGSMDVPLSAKSDMKRIDAACGVAMVGRELCEQVAVLSFSDQTVFVPPRRGFALRDAIVTSQRHSGTDLGTAITLINSAHLWPNQKWDRLIVITDEQSHTRVAAPAGKGYLINVASYQNGVGYGPWTHIDGFSEAVFQYIAALEGVSDGVDNAQGLEGDLETS